MFEEKMLFTVYQSKKLCGKNLVTTEINKSDNYTNASKY